MDEGMGAAAAELHDVLDAVGAVDLASLGDDALMGWWRETQRLRARVESLACRAALYLEAQGVPARRGLYGVPSLARRHSTADPKAVGADARLGWWTSRYGVLDEAFANGHLTRDHLRVLRQADNPRTAAALLEHQQFLVEQARLLTFPEFCRMVRYWVLAADPDGAEPDYQARRRRLDVRTEADGMLRGSFLVDPLAGSALRRALGAECERLRRAELDDPLSESTDAQRRADALVGLVGRGAARPDGRTPEPLVHLVVSHTAVEDLLDRAAHDHADAHLVPTDRSAPPPPRLAVHHDEVQGRCELVDGTAVHPRQAMAALMRGVLRRVVLGPQGEVLDLGRAARCFPRHLRDALLVSARGHCEIPGCDSPLEWLQADHLVPWARGGPTSTANGRIVCRPHNHQRGDEPVPPQRE